MMLIILIRIKKRTIKSMKKKIEILWDRIREKMRMRKVIKGCMIN